MILVASLGLLAAAGVIYVGQKSWYGIHRVLGIHPEPMIYKPSATGALHYYPQTQICFKRLTLNSQSVQTLPPQFYEHLEQIDHKLYLLQQWQLRGDNDTQNMPPSEQALRASKLINEQLPDLIEDHHQLQCCQQDTKFAEQTLAKLLHKIDELLTAQLTHLNQQQQYKHQIIQRYLDKV